MPGFINSAENRIVVEGDFTMKQMPRLIAAMHNMTTARGYQDVLLDFSHCEAAYQAPMLAVIARSQAYRPQGIDVSLALPLKPAMQRLFINTNWAHLLDCEKYPESEHRGFKHLPAMQFATANEQFTAVTKIGNAMLSALTDFDRSDLRAIDWPVNEITDNVINHSQSESGGYVQVTNYTGYARRIELVVVDAGISIPGSLRTTYHDLNDAQALDRAIREAVTRDKTVGQGNGLYGTWRITEMSGGRFQIYSGTALLTFHQRTLHIESQPVPFVGTLLIATIRYAQQIDLSEALRFEGRKHIPTDFVEMTYETDGAGNVEFRLVNESVGFGSRAAGEPIRRKLANLARVCGAGKVSVDLTDVPLVSSSYADEVFGKLFLEMGPMRFAETFSFRNVDPLVRQLIDKAITQRMNERRP